MSVKNPARHRHYVILMTYLRAATHAPRYFERRVEAWRRHCRQLARKLRRNFDADLRDCSVSVEITRMPWERRVAA